MFVADAGVGHAWGAISDNVADRRIYYDSRSKKSASDYLVELAEAGSATERYQFRRFVVIK
jgi:hypothetical protein